MNLEELKKFACENFNHEFGYYSLDSIFKQTTRLNMFLEFIVAKVYEECNKENSSEEKEYIPICLHASNRQTAQELGNKILKLIDEKKKNKMEHVPGILLEYLYLKIYENTISPDLFNN